MATTYVARQLKKKGIAFEQVDNAFVQLADPAAGSAGRRPFRQAAVAENPRSATPGKSIRCLKTELKGLSHYWVIDQAEYRHRLCASPASSALAGLFQRLLEFALLTFSPKKIFCYLGRKWHEQFDGEVQTHYKSVREPGACIKHFMKRQLAEDVRQIGSDCCAWKPSSINPENSRSYGNVSIATAPRRRVGIPCAKGLAICITIKAMPWPATNAIWKPWRRWMIRRRATTI